MNTTGFQAELTRILRAVRRFWWIPVVLALILAPATWFVGKSMSETYVARSQILVTPLLTGSTSITTESNRTQTYLQLVKSRSVLDRVIANLDLDITRAELAGKIETHIVPGTNIFEIQVRDADPEFAAEINNSIARQVEAQVEDVTTGHMQRTLDDLTYEVESLRDRVIVLDTRLSDLDLPENADDPEIQAEIQSIRTERLKLEQTIADLDTTIRSLNSEILKTSSPVAILDFASPPARPEGASALVLGVLGGIIGLGAGALVGLWREYTDPYVRDRYQVQSITGALPLAELNPDDLNDGGSPRLAMLGARVRARQNETGSGVALITTQQMSQLPTVVNALNAGGSSSSPAIIAADGFMTEAGAIQHVSQATQSAVLVVEYNHTRLDDLQETVDFLRSIGSSIIGTIIVRR